MTEYSRLIEELVLPLVKKPGRYVGELAVGCKGFPAGKGLKVLLAFPDTCEIGASNLGLRILVSAVSELDNVLVDVCFAPWPDFEAELRKRSIPLCSLCHAIPLAEFDVIGFSLQYELQYSNVLNMLELGRVPLPASERGESSPLVVAGGSCACNPEPLSDFIDCLALGDGEETIRAICAEAAAWRTVGSARPTTPEAQTSGRTPRQMMLERLSTHRGLYVPSRYPVERLDDGTNVRDVSKMPVVRSAVAASIDSVRPVLFVPRVEVTHDRLNVEVMRGCTHGCRFCMAGYVYRPVREKPADLVLAEVASAFSGTGHDELSLVSLSTPDYSCLPAILPALGAMLSSRGVEVTLPSMRPDTFTPELVKSLDSFKRSGLTLAPEAGTKRLRDVINKGMEDEEIVDAIVLAARFRWNLIKLYFMIGLPTETAEDVDAIPRLVERALRAAKSVNHRLSFNVSVSAFTPKPNTPFQWEAQLPMEEMNTRLREVARQTRRFGAKVRWRDPGVSFLEGVLARADRRAGEAIRLAVEKGARLDAWSDCFNLQIWLAAFERLGLSPEAFADARSVNSRLPWDHVRVVDTEFLRQERARAYEGILTEDCRMGTCQSCGVLDETGLDPAEVCLAGVLAGVSDASVAGTLAAPASVPSVGAVQLPGRAIGDSTVATRPSEFRVTGGRYRFQYEKKGKARFLSHLDMVKAFTRALRVSGLPVAYSEGFTRRPKISFGPPLPLGFTGASEYLDVELASAPETDPLAELNRLLPSGVRLLEWKRLEPGSPSLSSSCTTARYRVVFPEHLIAQTGLAPESFRETLATAIHNFDPGARATVGREGSPKQKEVLLGAAIRELSIVGAEPQGSVPQRAARPGGKPQPSGAWLPALDMLLSLSGPDTVRPDDAVVIILSGITLEKKYLQTERKAVYCNDKDGMRPPM